MGVGDGCWPMRPPGAVVTRTGMNTCGKQLLRRNCARLAPSAATPKAAKAPSVAAWRLYARHATTCGACGWARRHQTFLSHDGSTSVFQMDMPSLSY